MRAFATFALGLALAFATITVVAQPAAQDGAALPTVEELLAMPNAERNAALRSLDPKERLGLWFDVKRAQHGEGGGDMKKSPLDAAGWASGSASGTPSTRAVVGTIAYDSGMPTVSFSPGSPSLLGNRFNTHTGIPVCNPGTLSTVQALVVPGPGAGTLGTSMSNASAGFVMLGPQTGGGGAMAIFSTFGPATGTLDTLVFPGLGATYTGSEFFVLFGAFSSSYIPVFGPGSTLGQGHHGIIGNTGGMGPNITTTSPLTTPMNSFVRATGVIVPVELMTFDID